MLPPAIAMRKTQLAVARPPRAACGLRLARLPAQPHGRPLAVYDPSPTPRMHRSNRSSIPISTVTRSTLTSAAANVGAMGIWPRGAAGDGFNFTRCVRLTCFGFLQKGHHFFNALLAYKAQPKVAGKVTKSKREVRIIKNTACQFLRCNIARQRSLRGGINPG
jgi:hypothetical protein